MAKATTQPTTFKATSMMIRVLKATSAAPMTRKKIMEAEFGGNSVNLAPAIKPLIEANFLKETTIDVDGKKESLFAATAPGKKFATKAPAVPVRGNAEAHKPLPKAGGVITKTYKGKEITVKVTAEGFEYKGKKFASLTAAAKAVRESDQEVNGWAFFGLTKAAKAE